MGQAITASGGVGKMAANMMKSAGEEDPEREAELRERLSFLQRMAYTILDAKTNEILHSQEGDLKVKLGTIVDIHKRVEFEHSDSPKTFEAAVDSVMTDSLNGVFSDRVKSSIRGVVKTATNTFLSNDSVGEVKYEDIIVVWDNYALLLVDFFVWRYNFSTSNILQHVDAVYAYVIIKRVIDISKVSQELATYSTSNDCTCSLDLTRRARSFNPTLKYTLHYILASRITHSTIIYFAKVMHFHQARSSHQVVSFSDPTPPPPN